MSNENPHNTRNRGAGASHARQSSTPPASARSVRNSEPPKASAFEGDGGQTLVSRRKFLYGAVGVGAVVAAGVGAYAIGSSLQPEQKDTTVAEIDEDVTSLNAPESSLVTLNDFEALDSAEMRVSMVGTYDLDYGTLVWVNDDTVAACLLPTEKGSPLTQVGILNLSSGNLTKILTKAVGSKEQFEIYDVRANANGLIWTEANILGGTWRIYGAKLEGGSAGKAHLLEEGNTTYDTPTLAVAGSRGFWQVQPKAPNDEGLPSRLMSATFGSEDSTCVFESRRRMGTPPYSTGDSIVISPRIDRSSVYYQLTAIEAESGKVIDRLTMPQSMSPLSAGYGPTGFMFSLPDIYDNGTAISNLGTYTPREKPEGSNYDAAKWFGFARTPTAAPAWCDDLLIVKSSYSVCGVDLAAGNYFAIDVDDGADTYGDYLATTGSHPTFVTYANIDHTPVNEKAIHACRVKIWQPHGLTAAPAKDENSDGSESSEDSGAENAEDAGATENAEETTYEGEETVQA